MTRGWPASRASAPPATAAMNTYARSRKKMDSAATPKSRIDPPVGPSLERRILQGGGDAHDRATQSARAQGAGEDQAARDAPGPGRGRPRERAHHRGPGRAHRPQAPPHPERHGPPAPAPPAHPPDLAV